VPNETNPPLSQTGKARVKLAAVRRALKERPWIMASDVESYEGDGGPFVDIADENALPLGTALYSPDEEVRIRLFASASTREPLLLLRTRIERAQARRHADLMGSDAYRLLHAEADGIPRLFVDRFGKGLFAVTACQATDALTDDIVRLLLDVTGAETIVVWQRDGHGGFRPWSKRGDSTVVRYHHGRLVLDVDLASSFAISSLTFRLEAQRYLRRWAKGRVLDLYARDGGFGLQLADAGAAFVLAVEQEEALVDHIVNGAKQNGIGDRITVLTDDPSDRMRVFDEEGERFDLVVLNPDPALTDAKNVDAVKRTVFETHRRALRLLDEGRILVTWPGATALSESEFEEIVVDAALRSRKRVQVLARLSPGPDHPTLLGVAETRPATTLVMRVLGMA
jgi:23S rRNA (cytosine1962-C5)-methyltransferase